MFGIFCFCDPLSVSVFVRVPLCLCPECLPSGSYRYESNRGLLNRNWIVSIVKMHTSRVKWPKCSLYPKWTTLCCVLDIFFRPVIIHACVKFLILFLIFHCWHFLTGSPDSHCTWWPFLSSFFLLQRIFKGSIRERITCLLRSFDVIVLYDLKRNKRVCFTWTDSSDCLLW